jgi:hypothetical protein
MIFSRNIFFLFMFILFVMPLPFCKLIWLAGSRETTGTMYFTGHGNLGSVLGISTYPVIWFKAGTDTVYFNGNVNIPLKDGEQISVRYRKNNPQDARINVFSSLWGDTVAYMLAPFLIFLVAFFHPDLVPKKGKIAVGMKKPWLRFL